MMSRRCKYALKALVRLAKAYGKGTVLTTEIATSANMPKEFLELILPDLKRGGYVQNRQGARGGYQLVRQPKDITIADIYRLFDGAIALCNRVSRKNTTANARTFPTKTAAS